MLASFLNDRDTASYFIIIAGQKCVFNAKSRRKINTQEELQGIP